MPDRFRARLGNNEPMIERIVVASPGGWNAPSARYRLGPLARAEYWPVDCLSAGSFPRPDQLDALLAASGRSHVLVLQRVMPSSRDLSRLRRSYRAIVFDLDDAIYTRPPALRNSRRAGSWKAAARLALRGSPSASARRRPLLRTLRGVDVAVVGNEILGEFVGRHVRRVIEIPTTVEPVSVPPSSRPDPPVVTWMGLPDNMHHLEIVRPALERLRDELDFSLRIVSSKGWVETPIPVEFVAWSEEASRAALLSSTVGIAPLDDEPWTRGKCALRSIQYGGHALPTVASPVGITDQVVRHGQTGYLARTTSEWLDALRSLLTRPELSLEMGTAALRHVEASYSDSVALTRWSALISEL
jgi:glycosyltransferase involved in cell wall biosynthesis